MNEPYAATVRLFTSEVGFETQELLGERVTLSLERGERDRVGRALHGLVGSVTSGDEGSLHVEGSTCAVTIVPALSMLEHRRDTRIFQEMTVPEILREVLAPLRDYDATFEVRTSRTYPTCEYRTQYDETDLEFVQRLLAEEGMFLFFDQQRDAEHVIVADDPSAYLSLEGVDADRLPFYSQTSATGSEGISSFVRSDRTQPTKVALRHFDWTRHAVGLEGSSRRPTSNDPIGARVGGEREVYEHDAAPLSLHGYGASTLSYERDDRDAQLTRRRRTHATEALEFAGASTAIGLSPGRVFEFPDHPNPSLIGNYVAISITHTVEVGDAARDTTLDGSVMRAHFSSRFTAIPSDVVAEARRRGKRRVPGIVTATVVGPSGQEIHTDEHGRVRLQFHWDRAGRLDERSSCFVRVMQSWAGTGFGSWYVPRIGMEAVVSFLEGDPDRPLVTGTVYNGLQRTPFSLPEEATRSGVRTNSSPSTGGFNELRFKDAAGSEEVFLRAEKDLNEFVRHDHTTQVVNNQANIVIGTQSVTVGMTRALSVGMDETVTIGGRRTETVTGAETIRLLDVRDVDITRSDKLVVHDTQDEDVTGQMTGVYRGGRAITVETADAETVKDADKTVDVQGKYEITVDDHFRVKRGGSEIFVDDGIVAESPVKVELTVGGNSIVFDSGGTMTLTAESQLELVCGSASLTMKSDGTLAISASTKAEIASGSSVVAVESSKVSAQSSQVDLNGSSQVNVKGGMVNLN